MLNRAQSRMTTGGSEFLSCKLGRA